MGKSKDSKSHSINPKSKKLKSTPNKTPPTPNPNHVSSSEILSLLEPYNKDQLVTFLIEAIISDPSLLPRVTQLADSSTEHRKLFVHGFGHDATQDDMYKAFSSFGEIEECNMVCDKTSNRSKGYGFVTFKTRESASLALKEPHKQIRTRVTTCQLASVGPVPSGSSSASNNPDTMARKIHINNLHPDTQPDKLKSLFEQFGEIELGPIGFDLTTGKSRGFALFIYKTIQGVKNALQEPYKMFEGRLLHCTLANSSKKTKAQTPNIAPDAIPNMAALAAAQNLALYGHNPYAAALLLNPLAFNPLLGAPTGMAARVRNVADPLVGMSGRVGNPRDHVVGLSGVARGMAARVGNAGDLVGLNGVATGMAARVGNVGDRRERENKSVKRGLLGAYMGPSQSGQSSSAGFGRFPGFMW